MRWATVAALFSCALLAAPAQAGALKAIWGPTELEAGNAECIDPMVPCSAFPVYRRLGVDVFQFQIHWDEVAPTRPHSPRDPLDPAYDWGEIDQIVEQARANGIGLAALVQRAPGWANGGRPPIWAPRDPRDFADFLFAASLRFPGIRMWMIWGEPARSDNFRPMSPRSRIGPRLYARIVDASYVRLKQANRRNVVIGGMTLNGGTVMAPQFVQWMKLPDGRPPRMDLWGHNPFDGRFPDLSDDPIGRFRGLNDIDTLHEEIRDAYRGSGRRVPPFWLSEWTILSDKSSRIFIGRHVSRQGQARWLRAAYRIARRTPYVAGLGWFSLLDEPVFPGSANWGLMKADGIRKPAFGAYKHVP
jgi:hypothetical protein